MRTCVLFDHDGVLVDTEPWYFRAGADAYAEIGLTLDEGRYLRDMGDGAGTWAQARAAGVDERTIERLRTVRDDRYQGYLQTEPIEIDGVLEALEQLAGHVRMAVVTTARRRDFDLIHERRRIMPFMEFALVREDYGPAKPDPEPYLAGLRRLGASAAETLVVEDSARGLRSAIAAGIECAVVHNAFTQHQDFSRAAYRIRALGELPRIVLGAE